MNRSTAIRASQVFDGTGRVAKDALILTNAGRIQHVGPSDTIRVPAGSHVIDVRPCTVMPGLIDAHIHLGAFNCTTFGSARSARFEVSPQLQSFYALFHAQLCFEMGFTTLRDAGRGTPRGDFVEEMCALRDAIDAGIIPGPRLQVLAECVITGAHLELITLPRSMPRPQNFTADGPWDLRRKVRELIRSGADGIKTSVSGGIAAGTSPDVRNMTQEELNAIVDEAHAFRKRVAVHCFNAVGLNMCVNAGVDTIEHAVYSDDAAIARVRDSRIWVVPTLLNRSDYAIERNVQQGLPASLIAVQREIQPHCFETFRRMHRSGVRIAFGTDTHNVPEMGSAARELELYVANGMTPADALVTATRDAASALGLDADLGTLEAGKHADLIAVRGDPLSDIRILQDAGNIALVMKEGRVYVDRMTPTPRLVRHPEPGEWKLIDRV